jgi:choline-sulfatase
LILVDTLRADATSPYGFDARVSPTLGRLADEGVVFDRVLAQSSWTKVSMASLLTSLWPRSHGVREATDGLAERARTLQDVFQDSGYRTYAVQSNGWLEQSFGFHHGFDHYVFPHAMKQAGELGRSSVWPHGERVYDEAKRLLTAHEIDDPFFLYVHLMDVHEYAAPPEFKRFGDEQRAAYSAAIFWIDDVVKRILAELDRVGAAENTIVVFASDHAELFGENQSTGHARNVHTRVLHVPLILRIPGRPGGQRVSAQVRNIDIAPTILELSGLAVPPAFEGVSLIPLIEGREEGDRISFADLGASIMHGISEQVAVNDGRYSLLRDLDETGVEQLFDQNLDPVEDANLIDLEPVEAERMRALLDAHLDHDPVSGASQEKVRIDPGIANRLKALGYLQ